MQGTVEVLSEDLETRHATLDEGCFFGEVYLITLLSFPLLMFICAQGKFAAGATVAEYT